LNRVAVGDQDALGHDADSIQLRETLQCGRTAAQSLRAGSKEGCSCAKTVQRKGKYPLKHRPENGDGKANLASKLATSRARTTRRCQGLVHNCGRGTPQPLSG
jgi:hypothetical protein